jgi:hypothetical protein
VVVVVVDLAKLDQILLPHKLVVKVVMVPPRHQHGLVQLTLQCLLLGNLQLRQAGSLLVVVALEQLEAQVELVAAAQAEVAQTV